MTRRVTVVAIAVLAFSSGRSSVAAEWRFPTAPDGLPIYGIKGGLAFAIAPGGFRGERGGPRGLLRIGYPILPDGGYDLVNFIAVEPIVGGKKGFSELETSQLDRVRGKRFWVDPADWPKPRFVSKDNGVESMELDVHVEKFDNGASVRLVLAQHSDRPDELQLAVFPQPDSSTMEYCILTATMGNMARVRRLWLRDETVSSLVLYSNYKGNGFARHHVYPLERLRRLESGDVFVSITTDETDPAAIFPFPGTRIWYYGGFPVTQYWRKPKGTFRDDLHVAVNGRYTYWQSNRPIPGGVAFENFELRERFTPGQQFVFGITRRPP